MSHVTQSARLLACLMVTWVAPTAAGTCYTDVPITHPSGRLVDNRNGTVTDRATGLMWKQCAEGLRGAGCTSGAAQGVKWQEALQRGANTTFAGYSDWRLPNKNELESLVERSCEDPAINVTVFPKTPLDWLGDSPFWSSSPYAGNSDSAWFVNFEFGNVDNDGYKKQTRYVRLVRGGK